MKNSNQSKQPKNRFAFKGGTYSLVITAIVLAIIIVVNVFTSMLPTSLTRIDISEANLYSLTGSSKSILNALDQDVTLYWIVQADQEDSIIENLLDKYDSMSDHITVEKINPDTYPTFASNYTDETVANNSIVVECGDRSRYIAYSDIYLTEVDYTTYSYSYSFDGEGAITSAIGYVTTDELPVIYNLEGHGETDLPSKFSSQISKDNYELETLSLVNEDEIPEDAACILIYAPSTDISEEEKDILADYLNNGGKLMVLAGSTEDGTLENLSALLAEYGVETVDGIVVEGDRDHYAFQAPYVLLPDMASNDITDPLTEDNYHVIVPIAQGLNVTADDGSVTSLLTTSDQAFSKASGYNMDTYEKEDGDIDGGFSVGVSISTEAGGQMIWVSSSYFLDDTYNEYSSGANLDFAMNSLSTLVGQTEAVSIRTKSLSYNYLTISATSANIIKAVMIGIIPGAFVAIGIIVVIGRRRRRYEES